MSAGLPVLSRNYFYIGPFFFLRVMLNAKVMERRCGLITDGWIWPLCHCIVSWTRNSCLFCPFYFFYIFLFFKKSHYFPCLCHSTAMPCADTIERKNWFARNLWFCKLLVWFIYTNTIVFMLVWLLKCSKKTCFCSHRSNLMLVCPLVVSW